MRTLVLCAVLAAAGCGSASPTEAAKVEPAGQVPGDVVQLLRHENRYWATRALMYDWRTIERDTPLHQPAGESLVPAVDAAEKAFAAHKKKVGLQGNRSGAELILNDPERSLAYSRLETSSEAAAKTAATRANDSRLVELSGVGDASARDAISAKWATKSLGDLLVEIGKLERRHGF